FAAPRMTMEDLDDHPGAIEHLRTGCTFQVPRLSRRELVIDDDDPRLRRRVSIGLIDWRFRRLLVGIFEALACLRLPRDGARFDVSPPTRYGRESCDATPDDE